MYSVFLCALRGEKKEVKDWTTEATEIHREKTLRKRCFSRSSQRPLRNNKDEMI